MRAEVKWPPAPPQPPAEVVLSMTPEEATAVRRVIGAGMRSNEVHHLRDHDSIRHTANRAWEALNHALREATRIGGTFTDCVVIDGSRP